MQPTAQQRMAHRASNKTIFISAVLALSLMCSAVSAGFEGTRPAIFLQLAAILAPFAVGIVLGGRRFMVAPAWRRSPASGLLTFLFFISATISSCLAAVAYFDPYPLWFNACTVLAFIVWGGVWVIGEESVWQALRLYCILCTAAIVAVCLLTRVPGERFQFFLHPNLWGLLCFANFCLSGLIGKAAIRIPVQLANIMVILNAQSRSALVSTAVAAGVLIFFAVRSARLRAEERLLGLTMATGLCGAIIFFFRERLVTGFADVFRLSDPYRGSESGFTGRMELWQTGLKMIESNPLFGVGPRMEGNYMTGDVQYSHSGYISTFAQYGVIGATLFFAMAMLLGHGLWLMAMRQRPGASVGAALVIGYAAEAVFEPKLLNIGNPVSLLMLAFLLMPFAAGGVAGIRSETPGAALPLADCNGRVRGFEVVRS